MYACVWIQLSPYEGVVPMCSGSDVLSEKLSSLPKTVIFCVKEPQLPDEQILSWNSSLCTKMLGFTSENWLMD